MIDGPPSRFLDANETAKSTKYSWVGVVEGTANGKNRETVTASLCLVFKECGRYLLSPLIKSIINLFPWGRKTVKSGQYDMIDQVQLSISKHFQGTLFRKSI